LKKSELDDNSTILERLKNANFGVQLHADDSTAWLCPVTSLQLLDIVDAAGPGTEVHQPKDRTVRELQDVN
jgi:hypothetical protein